jgi:hypothetical protein
MNPDELVRGEDDLFAAWKDRLGPSNGIVTDGAASPADYLGSSPKVGFLLKEVNDADGGGWDLRQFVADGGRGATWNNIARWTLGVQALADDLEWSELQHIDHARRVAVLQSIVAFNVKKVPGAGTAIADDIHSAIDLGRDLIHRQARLYAPDVLVACGVGIAEVWPEVEIRSTRRGARYLVVPGTETVVLGFWHPQARYPDRLLYYYLIDAVREVLDPATGCRGADTPPSTN